MLTTYVRSAITVSKCPDLHNLTRYTRFILDCWPELPKLDHEEQRISLLYEKQSYEFPKVVLESLAAWLWRPSTKKISSSSSKVRYVKCIILHQTKHSKKRLNTRR